MIRFTKLILQNFQSIRDYTEIPIERLTLFFGPNSAGKSAIFDALGLLQLLCDRDFNSNRSQFQSLLARHARRGGEQAWDPVKVTIGLELETSSDFELEFWDEEDLHSPPSVFLNFIRGHSDGLKLEMRDAVIRISFDFLCDRLPSLHGASFAINRDSILSVHWRDEENRYWAHVKSREWMKVPTASESDFIRQEADQITIGPLKTWYVGSGADTWFDLEDPLDPANLFLQALLSLAVFTITSAVSTSGEGNNSSLPLVLASRTVPNRGQCVFAVSGAMAQGQDGQLVRAARVETHSFDTIYGTLAASFLGRDAHLLYLANEFSRHEDAPEQEVWWELNTPQRVNSLLREELFKEKGYRLATRSLFLIKKDDLDGVQFPETKARLVHLYLFDAEGRKLEIEDVGSGIGYALPVLAALCHRGRAWIQQPELHLHPAMQGGMGEAIVKAVENKQWFDSHVIVETHSENLLLRILKMLRRPQLEDEMEYISRLTYRDVALIYFDPQMDGTTKVSRIRLAPDGSFVDRWPRGFFLERLNDLDP